MKPLTPKQIDALRLLIDGPYDTEDYDHCLAGLAFRRRPLITYARVHGAWRAEILPDGRAAERARRDAGRAALAEHDRDRPSDTEVAESIEAMIAEHDRPKEKP